MTTNKQLPNHSDQTQRDHPNNENNKQPTCGYPNMDYARPHSRYKRICAPIIIAYIACIFQRAQQVSIQYISEHYSIYRLYTSASATSINSIFQRALTYIACIFQRAQQVPIQYFSEHYSIYRLYILASAPSINLIFQRISLVYFSERNKYQFNCIFQKVNHSDQSQEITQISIK